MKRLKDFSAIDLKASQEIKGGTESSDVITDYIETGEIEVIDGAVFPRTHWMDCNGNILTDRKVCGIIVALKLYN